MREYFPILQWLKNYKRENLLGDFSAGLTVGVMLVPQGMAYSLLAGLPPIYGLYAATIPLLIYAIFGTSRQLAVGPVAMVALLISSGIGQLSELGSSEFISLAILLAFLVGFIQLVMGVFKMGFVVNFLSHPVIAGFTSAAALIIGFSQLKHLLGIEIPRGMVHETILNVCHHVTEINFPTLILGVISVLVIFVIKNRKSKLPAPLVVVVLSILGVHFFGLEQWGVKIVGEVPSGFPDLSLPSIKLSSIKSLLPVAFAISFVSFMESIAVAKAIQKKHKDYEIDSNQELIALGLANILGSFFKAFPITGGFSRTAVNNQAGAKTGLAAIVSAALVTLTLVYLTSYFYKLPYAVLSAIIMVAVFGLIDFREAKHLWKTDKKDFSLFLITALGTLFLGIEEGIILGAFLSLILVIYSISYPNIATLGRSSQNRIYKNIDRFDDVFPVPKTLIIRLDARLYFANLNYFKNYVFKKLEKYTDTKYFILDATAINGIDSSGVHFLHDFIQDLKLKNIDFFIVGAKGMIRDVLVKSELIKMIGLNNVCNNADEVIKIINDGVVPNHSLRKYAVESKTFLEPTRF